ncbi:MAG: tetratricopeptide repeat protein [Planctomycetes bacterium]|nr:tetratricopeptide repeat protein [Planctomycetota bacterium]
MLRASVAISLALAAGLVQPAVAQDGEPTPSPETLAALGENLARLIERADRIALYRTLPEQTQQGANIGGYSIVEEKRLEDPAARRRMKETLFDGGVYGTEMAKCFIPHHAIRVRSGEEAASLVVSFECSQLLWIEGQKTVIIRSEGRLLDTLEALLSGGDGHPGEPPGENGGEESAGAHVARANDLLAKGDVDAAQAEFDRAIALDPAFAAAYSGRAMARQARGDLRGAIEDLERALALDPANGETRKRRGGVRAALGDMDGARADLDEALRINPADAGACAARGSLLQSMGDLEGAIRDLTRAIELDPRMAEAYVRRANARQKLGDLAGAVEDYARAIECDPALPDAWSNRGAARYAMGDVDAAISDLERALAVAPANWPARKSVEEALARVRAAREKK